MDARSESTRCFESLDQLHGLEHERRRARTDGSAVHHPVPNRKTSLYHLCRKARSLAWEDSRRTARSRKAAVRLLLRLLTGLRLLRTREGECAGRAQHEARRGCDGQVHDTRAHPSSTAGSGAERRGAARLTLSSAHQCSRLHSDSDVLSRFESPWRVKAALAKALYCWVDQHELHEPAAPAAPPDSIRCVGLASGCPPCRQTALEPSFVLWLRMRDLQHDLVARNAVSFRAFA